MLGGTKESEGDNRDREESQGVSPRVSRYSHALSSLGEWEEKLRLHECSQLSM